jgi:hypothetical protein
VKIEYRVTGAHRGTVAMVLSSRPNATARGLEMARAAAVAPSQSRGEITMNKNNKSSVKRVKLALRKETVQDLTGDMLKVVAGGMIPETRISACFTACINNC